MISRMQFNGVRVFAADDRAAASLRVVTIAWPRFVPLGSVVAFVWGSGLSERKERAGDALMPIGG